MKIKATSGAKELVTREQLSEFFQKAFGGILSTAFINYTERTVFENEKEILTYDNVCKISVRNVGSNTIYSFLTDNHAVSDLLEVYGLDEFKTRYEFLNKNNFIQLASSESVYDFRTVPGWNTYTPAGRNVIHDTVSKILKNQKEFLEGRGYSEPKLIIFSDFQVKLTSDTDSIVEFNFIRGKNCEVLLKLSTIFELPDDKYKFEKSNIKPLALGKLEDRVTRYLKINISDNILIETI